MIEEDRFAEAMVAVGDYAHTLGMIPVNQVEECWEQQVDENWWIAVNGHKEVVECSRGIRVQPFTCYVEFNGWPAGIIHAYGGVLAAGDAANEDTFVAALREKTKPEDRSF